MDLTRLRTFMASGLGCALLIAQGVAAPAAQAHYDGRGQPEARISIQPYNYGTGWNVPIDRAIANWNATASPADIFKYSSSGAYLEVAGYSDTFTGQYTNCGPGCYIIRINSRAISEAKPTNLSNFITSVAVHEWGHAFDLADIPYGSSGQSIMAYARDRNLMTTPQPHDVADVNDYY